jgi:class 3 adenylate cyclase/tetratricopeptide (TPR) repeat protein
VRCAKCSVENREGRKFCAECGTALNVRCPSCRTENEPAEKFCGDCGAPLSAPVSASVAESQPFQVPEVVAERRHLTIVFCDLVGSTTLAAQVDPEEWHATVAGYQHAAAEAITRFGGDVRKYVGDGIMAFFGYPVAHDNDAERAARAGLAMLDAIERRNEQPKHTALSVRIGIHSGPVVVGAGAGKEVDAFGDAANIAARVQAAAEPGSVVISEATQRLVAGLFIVEDRGAQALKGIERPVRLYRVIRPSGARGRFEAATLAGGLTPFVGREDELRSLRSRWERVLEGEGQVVTIIGEAGIGKSRLLQRFHEEIAGTPHTWLECGTTPFFQNTPFFAVSGMFQQSFQWDANQSTEQRLNGLEASLALAGLDPAETAPLIAPLLELPTGDRYPPLSISPDQQRKRLLGTLAGWTFGAAKAQPLVIATEDLHWADPSTLELTELLVEQSATVRLLLLYTARPEFRAQWPQRAHHTQIMLNRLSARQVLTMVGEVAAPKALSEETIAAVVERTGGVPLFVEELTRAVLESGEAKLSGREIPATLHDSLMARLDRLGSAKEIIQVGAVIGGDFSYELLHAVHPIPEVDLQRALRALMDAELLYVRGIAPEATYQFKHALIRDAAYEALLRSKRRELHRRVAETISEKFSTLAEAQPQVLARHWAEAGDTERAIEAWKSAGDAAYSRRAFKEAELDHQQALAMLKTLPESPERDARELEFASVLVQVLQLIKGYSAPDAIAAAARARALAEKSGNLGQLATLQIRRWSAVFTSGDYIGATALADQILEAAGRDGNRGLAFAHIARVQACFYRGDPAGAEEHFTHLSSLLEGSGPKQFPGTTVLMIGVTGLGAWTMGRINFAGERIARGIAFARESRNPYDMTLGLLFLSYLHRFRREPQPAETASTQMLALAEEQDFSWGCDLARGVLGWARAHLGSTSDGVSMIRKALLGQIAVGARIGITDVLTRLAEAQALDGATTDALRTIEEALHANPQELLFRPHAMTYRGELRNKLGQTELAEADFREAIAMAQKMSAKSWELRASTSLARLLRDADRRDEARAMLAESYNWFSEGFDTADLKDAKALLDELGQ